MERPDDTTLAETAERTRLALERITHGKIKAAQPKHVPKTSNESTYIRYTPANQTEEGGKQRIIKMTEVQEDPLEPPRFKHKKIPRGPTEPPPPVMQSPPRAATAQDQKDWMIPPCISNWKNNKGFTIPLDKRLAADGRGLQDVSRGSWYLKELIYIGYRCISMTTSPSSQRHSMSRIGTLERRYELDRRCNSCLRRRRRRRRRRTCVCWRSVHEKSATVSLLPSRDLHPLERPSKRLLRVAWALAGMVVRVRRKPVRRRQARRTRGQSGRGSRSERRRGRSGRRR